MAAPVNTTCKHHLPTLAALHAPCAPANRLVSPKCDLFHYWRNTGLAIQPKWKADTLVYCHVLICRHDCTDTQSLCADALVPLRRGLLAQAESSQSQLKFCGALRTQFRVMQFMNVLHSSLITQDRRARPASVWDAAKRLLVLRPPRILVCRCSDVPAPVHVVYTHDFTQTRIQCCTSTRCAALITQDQRAHLASAWTRSSACWCCAHHAYSSAT